MGFLNLSAWRAVGGRKAAERRARVNFAQPPKYYYDHLMEFQTVIDSFFETHVRRPEALSELFLWKLEKDGRTDDDVYAADLADLYSYYEIERNSLLAMVSIDLDHGTIAEELLEVRRLKRRQGTVSARPAATAAAATAAAALASAA